MLVIPVCSVQKAEHGYAELFRLVILRGKEYERDFYISAWTAKVQNCSMTRMCKPVQEWFPLYCAVSVTNVSIVHTWNAPSVCADWAGISDVVMHIQIASQLWSPAKSGFQPHALFFLLCKMDILKYKEAVPELVVTSQELCLARAVFVKCSTYSSKLIGCVLLKACFSAWAITLSSSGSKRLVGLSRFGERNIRLPIQVISEFV